MPDLWCFSSGRLSPTDATHPKNSTSQPLLSSDDDDRRSLRSDVVPHRTLVIPSSIPGGKTIEIPLGSVSLTSSRQDLSSSRNDRERSPKPESQMEKLTQRLKNLAKPFRSPSRSTDERDKLRCASPADSSGISADITDSNSGEDTKRASDLSSLSSADPNSSISDSSEEAKLQPPAIVRHPRQPYLTRLARENPVSTSVLQTVFDNIERPEIKRFGENNNGKEWMNVPVSVEEDMRRNDSTGWNLIPTTVTAPKPRPVLDVNEEAIQSRKRIVCTQMSESLKAIDNACAQISKVTAPQHWRAPHLLQTSLNTLRDSVSTAHDALGMFVDGTGRISIDRKNPKAEELDDLLRPLVETRNHLTHLRKNLDAAGWTVSVLSRDSESSRSMDSLEQFIAAVQKVPSDCRRLLQWTQLLIPSSSIVFLSPIADTKPEDRQLVRFYAPQLDQHTESLSLAIEDFLGTVENNLPPREFVQKGKLIILAAHKLIYIGDTVSQCVGDRAASNSLRQCADRLCELLKECVRATKLASEE
ncbi:hypothetical protein OSTOST_08552, partial [Ostertagia ostertagi]